MNQELSFDYFDVFVSQKLVFKGFFLKNGPVNPRFANFGCSDFLSFFKHNDTFASKYLVIS